MILEQYLKAMEDCSHELVKLEGFIDPMPRVQVEFGVYDNYRILLNKTSTEVKEILQESDIFVFEKTTNFFRETHYFKYEPGIIMAQLYSGVRCSEDNGKYVQIKKDFSSTITLHPYQNKDMLDIRYDEAKLFGTKESNIAIIRAIKDLTNILTKNKISFGLPGSVQDNYNLMKFSL